MKRATVIVLSMALGAVLSGVAVAAHYAEEMERATAERPPQKAAEVTDDQLLAFWFGGGHDPARLRERACGRRPRK